MRDLNDDAMPGGVHPGLAHLNREALLDFARRSSGRVVVPDMRAMAQAYANPEQTISAAVITHDLTLRRVMAPAPYIGPEQQYIWEVLTDELGRSIADDHVYRLTNPHEATLYGYDWQDIDDAWERRNEGSQA